MASETKILYVIRDVNTLCRPCWRYEDFKQMNLPAIFFVENDFSDNDISNFRYSFKIRNNDQIQRMNYEWYRLCKLCDKKKRGKSNFYIFLDDKAEIVELRRF